MLIHVLLSFTELLQSWEKPIPFRNRYYFSTLQFLVTSPQKPKVPDAPSIEENTEGSDEQDSSILTSEPKVTTVTEREIETHFVAMVTRYVFLHYRKTL